MTDSNNALSIQFYNDTTLTGMPDGQSDDSEDEDVETDLSSDDGGS